MLKLLVLVPLLVVTVTSEYGGLFREYKEDLNEYLTSEEVDRLVYGNDESVISDKIKMLPDTSMNPPGVSQHHLPIPTMEPGLESLGGAPIVKKLPPPRNNFMSMVKTAAARMLRNGPRRSPRQRNPTPHFRERHSTLTSSPPDPLEMAFKRIEIMASRAGLNMSAMPRRTQMQIIKRLIPKLPPRMAQLMKTTMDHNSVKMYDYLPEPSRDPLIEDNPDFLSHFMDDAKVTMDGADFSLNEHHTFEFVDPTVSHEIVPPTSTNNGESIVITDHQPGTDYSIPSYESPVAPSAQPFGFSAPPVFDHSSSSVSHSSSFGSGNGDHSSGSHSYETHSISSDYTNSNNNHGAHGLDLKPVAAPLVSETHDIQYESAQSENLPMIISPNSPKYPIRSNKALKITSIKTVTPSAPVIRVSMPTKDEIAQQLPLKINKPIRVSIITKENKTSNPFIMSVDPVFHADVVEIKHSAEEIKESSSIEAALATLATTTSTTKTPTTTTATTSEAPLTLPTAASDEKFISMPSSGEKSPPTAGLLLKEFDDYADDQDLTSSELIAELKKYNSEYANSLELDYPLAPHPLEYPDHPDHPDNSEAIHSTATTLTTPRPTAQLMQQQQQQQQERERERPLPMRPMKPHGPRPPMRPRIRPPPGHVPGPGPMRPNNRPIPPRRPVRPFRPPLRINEVTVSQIPQTIHKECDYFSEDLCLAVQDYPVEAISEAVTSSDANNLLVKEPGQESSWVDGVGKNQEGGYNFKHYFGDGKVNNGEGGHRHRDFAGEGGFLCPSKVAYGRVKKGKSYTSGEWKYIVNYGDVSQTLRLEKCLSPGNSCSYVLPHYRTACTQVYNYHRLLAWDSEKGLHMDIFKIPTCCTCHVQGYYIPGQQQHGMTPARRRDLPPKLQYSPQQQQRLRQAQQQQHQQQQQQQQQQKHAQLRREQQTQQQAQQQALQAKQQQSKLSDELQDLLAQYSILRDRIAKKKNERQSSVTYSVSYSNSTKENSKRESSNQEAPADGPRLDLKTPMKRLQRQLMNSLMKKIKKSNSTMIKKKLTNLLKAANLTAKPSPNLHPSKASHFNGTAHKIKSGRSMHLHRLASLLGIIKRNGNNGTTNSTTSPRGAVASALSNGGGRSPLAGTRRLQGQRALLQGNGPFRRNGRQHMMKEESKLEKLKLLLSRSLLKHRGRPGPPPPPPHALGPINKNGNSQAMPNNLKRQYLIQKLQQRRRNRNNNNNNNNSSPSRTKQRLRIKSNKPSKVNYSYHPIMDYYKSR